MSRELKSKVNNCLRRMHSIHGPDKGFEGEEAVFCIFEQLYLQYGGILYHSYCYEVDPTQKGNVKKGDGGELYCEKLGTHTEVDILYVSEKFIYLIEVKSYKANTITLTDGGISGCHKTDKSPIHQNEMHARHLYSGIYAVLPEGYSSYIIPITVFVDKAKIIDKRGPEQRAVYHIAILDTIEELIQRFENLDTQYCLDLPGIDTALLRIHKGHSKKLPLRRV